MLEDLISKEKINNCVVQNAHNLISTLLNEEVNFSIFCYINNVKFNPTLPENINVNFKSLTIFALSGYTFTTVKLNKQRMIFEAGFGEENISSNVTVPLNNILQILIGENVIFVNPFSDGLTQGEKIEKGEDELAASMKAILSNPKNKNMLKK